MSHSAFCGLDRKHLDRLVAEPAGPWHAQREARLRHGRGRDRQRRAGRHEVLQLRDRILLTLAWLRLGILHAALAVLYRVDRSTISAAIGQVRPLLAGRGFATENGVRLHTLADVVAYAAA